MQSLKLREDQELTEAELLESRVPLGFPIANSTLSRRPASEGSIGPSGYFCRSFALRRTRSCFRTALAAASRFSGKYKIFAYLLSSVSMMSMVAWLLWGERLGEIRPYFGGTVPGGLGYLADRRHNPFTFQPDRYAFPYRLSRFYAAVLEFCLSAKRHSGDQRIATRFANLGGLPCGHSCGSLQFDRSFCS